jgi:OFA family oxalate/formate antiporter-like MFS transporter
MRKYLTVLASFIIMLCLGSVYAWSIIAAELIQDYHFSASQAQIIFGTIIAIFPVTMIFVGQLAERISPRYIAYISGILFFAGNIIASYSNGNFIDILIGIGIFTGVATGFGYWVALTTPVQWFPGKKGLITGIAAAGFGLGAVLMSDIAERILFNGKDVLYLFAIIGISYGLLILISSNFITQNTLESKEKKIRLKEYIGHTVFKKLFIGIFLGTFAGLLIIGNLKIIGSQGSVSPHYLILGVSLFAIANFLGRITWGFIADYTGASLSIFMALLMQSVAIMLLNIIALSDVSYMLLAFFIGFGFGGNFVLFARETAHVFGLSNLGIVYPYVFIGYAIAGIAGPFAGGLLYDITSAYSSAIWVSGIMSLAGSILFLYQYTRNQNMAQ